MTRLESRSPELAEALVGASVERRRAAVLAACEFGITKSGIDDSAVRSALARFRAGEPIGTDLGGKLQSLTLRLDDEYFRLQSAAEQGQARREECLRAFGKARAVAALGFAGKGDSHEWASEAIYEAAASSEDAEQVFELVRTALANAHSVGGEGSVNRPAGTEEKMVPIQDHVKRLFTQFPDVSPPLREGFELAAAGGLEALSEFLPREAERLESEALTLKSELDEAMKGQ